MENRFLSSDEKLLESGLFSDVTVKCGNKAWSLHKNILCSRSVWFNKALTGNYTEATSRTITIDEFEPEAVDWVIRYIYTGLCDITTLRPRASQTNFVTCIEVFTVADYFAMDPLVKIALDTLAAEFDSKLAAMQIQYEPSDTWIGELFEAIRLIYGEIGPLPSSKPSTPIRQAFVNFAHTARFYLLQNEGFNAFLDEGSSAQLFALDMFRAMRQTGDFVAHLPEDKCTFCRNKPKATRGGERGYFTHLAPERLRLVVGCLNCVVKKDFAAATEDWNGKLRGGGGTRA